MNMDIGALFAAIEQGLYELGSFVAADLWRSVFVFLGLVVAYVLIRFSLKLFFMVLPVLILVGLGLIIWFLVLPGLTAG